MTDQPANLPAPSSASATPAQTAVPTPGAARRRRPPRRLRFIPPWVGGAAFFLVVAASIAAWWWAHGHMLAASAIAIRGGKVSWDWGDGKWRHGGETTVEYKGAFYNLTDADLEPLPKLRHVVEVDLANCNGITEGGLAVLRKLSGLQRLNLERSRGSVNWPVERIGNAVVEHLRGLNGLRELSLAGSEVTDAGLERLSVLRNLEMLDLTGTRVTDAGLLHLRQLPKLRTLIVDSPGVTPAGSGVLLKANPNLDIQHPLVSGAAP